MSCPGSAHRFGRTSGAAQIRIGSYLQQSVDPDRRIGERAMRVYVADRRKVLELREVFVRAAYAPGDQSQFNVSPMSVYLAGGLVVVQRAMPFRGSSQRKFGHLGLVGMVG